MLTQELDDKVNHPSHYNSHPSGVEVIQITEHLNFCMGNAVKYVLRADYKGDPLTDLHKAVWYLNREIARREIELHEATMAPLFGTDKPVDFDSEQFLRGAE